MTSSVEELKMLTMLVEHRVKLLLAELNRI
jgi:hypothetical protein